jgi:hypothetical protein
MRKALVTFAVASVLLLVSPAFAQGPYLGVGFVYNFPVGSDIRYLDSGPGLDFTFGYNFGPVALEGNMMGSWHDDSDPAYGHADFGGISIDLRVFLLPLVRPNQAYLLVGFGSYWLYEYDPYLYTDTELDGYGWNMGAGFEHYFSHNIGLNAEVIYRFIRYDQFDAGGFVYSINHQNGDTVTVQAGVVFYW